MFHDGGGGGGSLFRPMGGSFFPFSTGRGISSRFHDFSFHLILTKLVGYQSP